MREGGDALGAVRAALTALLLGSAVLGSALSGDPGVIVPGEGRGVVWHSGPLDADGCHYDERGRYHCH